MRYSSNSRSGGMQGDKDDPTRWVPGGQPDSWPSGRNRDIRTRAFPSHRNWGDGRITSPTHPGPRRKTL